MSVAGQSGEGIAALEPAERVDGAPGAMLVIISGPSGGGKDTIIDAVRLRTHEPEALYVVTRATRGGRATLNTAISSPARRAPAGPARWTAWTTTSSARGSSARCGPPADS